MAGNEGGDGGSVEKWPFWMSNGEIWGTHPACREHKLQSQFIITELLQLHRGHFMLFQWLFTTSLHLWFALVSPLWSLTQPLQKHYLPQATFFVFLFPKGKKEGKKTIGKVTSIKILTVECIEFAWQTQPAGLCWCLYSATVLYISINSCGLQKESSCCYILIFFAYGKVYFPLFKSDNGMKDKERRDSVI